MPSATITCKGQVTVPKSVRQALKVGAGDRLKHSNLFTMV